MQDFRPVGHVIGWLALAMGLTLMLPTALDWFDGSANWPAMLSSSFLTIIGAITMILACREAGRAASGLGRRQAFLLTTLVWVVLPLFGALPMMLGAPELGFADAYFEAMSGMTTTGATVIGGLETMPRGLLLWRGMLQWFGGLGIVIVAIVFLPAMRIGGMQFFQSESFDLSGDILPRATEVAGSLLWIYVGLTSLCYLAYAATGVPGFDAIVHAMTTISTGGFANYDDSFGSQSPAAHYVGSLFMMLAALPFVRFISIARGNPEPLWRDTQIRAFVGVVLAVSVVIAIYIILDDRHAIEQAFRESLFNVASVMTGTGFASDPYDSWGGFPVGLFFILALIGGCSGSTSCSAKVFRYQILLSALTVQIRRIHSPHAVYLLHYQGRAVDPEVVSSIMGFFFVFFVALSVWAILLSLLGLDTLTAISGSVAALCNLGPGLGRLIGPAGNFEPLSDTAKWLLSFGMLLGRLEFLSVLVLFTPVFWRR